MCKKISLQICCQFGLKAGLIFFALSQAILVHHAFADGLVVKQNIVLNGHQLLLGDIFPQAANKEHIVMSSIRPGETRSLDKFKLLNLANKYQLDWLPNDNFTAVTVERSRESVDEDTLKGLIEDKILQVNQTEFDTIHIKLLVFNHALPLAAQNDVLYTIGKFDYQENSGNFQGKVNIFTEGKNYPVKFQGSAILQKKIPTLKRPLQRGSTIKEKDVIFRMEKVNNIHGNTITEKDDVIGMQTTHHIRANKAFTHKDLREPILVKNKQKVVMILKSSKMRISTQGVALSSGTKGEIIDVRNANSGIIVSGTIISAETVEINLAGQSAQHASRQTQSLTQVN